MVIIYCDSRRWRTWVWRWTHCVCSQVAVNEYRLLRALIGWHVVLASSVQWPLFLSIFAITFPDNLFLSPAHGSIVLVWTVWDWQLHFPFQRGYEWFPIHIACTSAGMSLISFLVLLVILGSVHFWLSSFMLVLPRYYLPACVPLTYFWRSAGSQGRISWHSAAHFCFGSTIARPAYLTVLFRLFFTTTWFAYGNPLPSSEALVKGTDFSLLPFQLNSLGWLAWDNVSRSLVWGSTGHLRATSDGRIPPSSLEQPLFSSVMSRVVSFPYWAYQFVACWSWWWVPLVCAPALDLQWEWRSKWGDFSEHLSAYRVGLDYRDRLLISYFSKNWYLWTFMTENWCVCWQFRVKPDMWRVAKREKIAFRPVLTIICAVYRIVAVADHNQPQLSFLVQIFQLFFCLDLAKLGIFALVGPLSLVLTS